MKRRIGLIAMMLVMLAGTTQETVAQTNEHSDSTERTREMNSVVVRAKQSMKSASRIENVELIGPGQLVRAACCNLGESFTTNPSVDVSYSDAATGAQQIKLLGLSGTYVQMLTENVPNFRGASIPYSLAYVPGPWMQSIQVSKGAASVKNGYESTTGQINIEYLKPQATDGIRGNAYLNTDLGTEVNLDGNIHLTDRLSTSLLTHFDNQQRCVDDNGDGFLDMPQSRQYNVMNRWAYVAPKFISQLSLRYLHDDRENGMTHKAAHDNGIERYGVGVLANRYEGQWKNAYLFRDGHNSSLALILHGSIHDADNQFGHTLYDITQQNGYAQLLYETDLRPQHNLSVGASVNYDRYRESASGSTPLPLMTDNGRLHETTAGLYAQYTYKLGDKFTAMPGLRWDHSSIYGSFLTPRLHLKYTPCQVLTLRGSVGKGYRSPHALAENTPLLASGRTFSVPERLKQEEAWNYGLSAALNFPIAQRKMELNIDYYYTMFQNQMVINVDGAAGMHTVVFENLDGRSYSHTFQVDATYPIVEDLVATAAFRWTDARTTYDDQLKRRPLTSRYKGLLTLSYSTPTKLWQIDVTGQLNGKGDLYDHTTYPAYFQLQAQVTREFRHFSLYVGGENLTNYTIKHPILSADNPWSSAFDATQVWGPMNGVMGYVGIRFKLEKM